MNSLPPAAAWLNKNMKKKLILIYSLLLLSGVTYARLTSIDGYGHEFWHKYSLVWGEVTATRDIGSNGVVKEIDINCLATVSGYFDPTEEVTITAQYAMFINSAITSEAEAGHRYLLLIYVDKGIDEAYQIPTDFVTFLPGNCAIEPMDSMDYKKVNSIVEEIRKLRGSDGSSPYELALKRRVLMLRERGVDTTEFEKKHGISIPDETEKDNAVE